jgi:CHASE1-domain containing sensor protein
MTVQGTGSKLSCSQQSGFLILNPFFVHACRTRLLGHLYLVDICSSHQTVVWLGASYDCFLCHISEMLANTKA